MPRKRRPRLSWFRFFPDDFIGGTVALSAPETGRYLLLLLHQWGTKERQLIPTEPERLRLICRGEDPGPLVLAKFAEVPGGLRNLRLASEWDETKSEFEGKMKGGGAHTVPDTAPVSAADTVPDTGTVRVRKPEPHPHNGNGERTSVAIAPAPWSAQACDDWSSRFGGTAPGGIIGKALKPLITAHGWSEVRTAWQAYLGQADAEYASAARFASTYGRWSGTVAPAAGKESVTEKNRRVIAAYRRPGEES